ncbi:hypothetical protein J6590_059150, partial [Homalodisca vitripennis]
MCVLNKSVKRLALPGPVVIVQISQGTDCGCNIVKCILCAVLQNISYLGGISCTERQDEGESGDESGEGGCHERHVCVAGTRVLWP